MATCGPVGGLGCSRRATCELLKGLWRTGPTLSSPAPAFRLEDGQRCATRCPRALSRGQAVCSKYPRARPRSAGRRPPRRRASRSSRCRAATARPSSRPRARAERRRGARDRAGRDRELRGAAAPAARGGARGSRGRRRRATTRATALQAAEYANGLSAERELAAWFWAALDAMAPARRADVWRFARGRRRSTRPRARATEMRSVIIERAGSSQAAPGYVLGAGLCSSR